MPISRVVFIEYHARQHWSTFFPHLFFAAALSTCRHTRLLDPRFRISSSFVTVGNNPSIQIHSFSEDLRECNKTGNPSITDFSTILTGDIQFTNVPSLH